MIHTAVNIQDFTRKFNLESKSELKVLSKCRNEKVPSKVNLGLFRRLFQNEFDLNVQPKQGTDITVSYEIR